MKEILLNNYLKIEPIKYDSFVSPEKSTYEMVGIVVNKDEKVQVPIGVRVWFDSFMAKKYPVPGKENEYEYFVSVDEVVKYEDAG